MVATCVDQEQAAAIAHQERSQATVCCELAVQARLTRRLRTCATHKKHKLGRLELGAKDIAEPLNLSKTTPFGGLSPLAVSALWRSQPFGGLSHLAVSALCGWRFFRLEQ